ncbi:MAG: deoxyribodipyrimidine photo-lyase, partial [Methylophilaceae bacterium]|nr:deoxyribodipyrimidine photo-lyase [Methylophilaceae bacterium]
MPSSFQSSLVWFRRDLRDYDHAALYHALKTSKQVYCAFIFDTEILDQLTDKADRRVEFIWESVRELKSVLQQQGGDLIVRHGAATTEMPKLALELKVDAVFANRDYEPSAIARDTKVAKQLQKNDIQFHDFKDQVIFEKDEVLTLAGKPFGVFTPYKNAALKKLNDFFLSAYPADRYKAHLAKPELTEMPSLEHLGFTRSNLASMKLPTGMSGAQQLFADFVERIHQYKAARDFPAIKGPSYLSV